MQIIQGTSESDFGGRKLCLAIGVFDGVHIGHQQIIRQTVSDARRDGDLAVVVTFDQHPNSIVAPDRVPPLIYSFPQKTRAIGALGVDALLVLRFDRAFSQQSGEEFIHHLAERVGRIHGICVGSNFVFGRKRSGDIELLKRMGKELAFSVEAVAPVALDGGVVSSTRIREAIAAGDLGAAGRMLGRAYSIAGDVIRGNQLGHKLGFPTANLEVAGLLLPPMGVYAGRTTVGGRSFGAVMNLGRRPTLDRSNATIHVEVHLLDFEGDLYGGELEVVVLRKLREEARFASLDELKRQIARDIVEARAILRS